MKIRRGKIADAAFIAKKVLQAITLEDNIEEDAVRELTLVCEQEDTLYSYCHALVAEEDDERVGLALCYAGADYRQMRKRTFPRLKFFKGTDPDQMPDETEAGEYYLDSLAVEPVWRGKGIGHALLKAVKQQAKELGLVASLLVEPENERAKHLYQSEGFVEQDMRPAFGHEYRVMRLKPQWTGYEQGLFQRTELLLGEDRLERLTNIRVIVFGVGGVGSWCCEALVRSGVKHLTLVDSDRVCVSNCNRQLEATCETIGQVKVGALRERMLLLNPEAEVEAIQAVYSADTADQFHLEEYDYVVDAIDSVRDKAHLILTASRIPTVILLSSMGAALRVDPTQVRVAEFGKIKGDALARALRNHFKRLGQFPERKFRCVYSEEQPREVTGGKGSVLPVTGAFGFTLASLVMTS